MGLSASSPHFPYIGFDQNTGSDPTIGAIGQRGS